MLNICFFGTSDNSSPILKTLKMHSNLRFCVTKKDTLFGRHQIIKETGVKTWCKKEEIEYFEIENLKTPDIEIITEHIIDSNIDYIFVADFSYIIPSSFLNTFDKKVINIHFSLLPKYRGASPVQAAILFGEKITGVTFQYVSPALDKGDILMQYEYMIPNNITSGELIRDLFQLSSEKLPDFLGLLENKTLIPIKQDEALATYTSSPTQPTRTLIFKEDSFTDLGESALILDRKCRAYHPWPVLWTLYKYLIESNVVLNFEKQHIPTVRKSNISPNMRIKIHKVRLEGDKIEILMLQPEGKNTMSWDEFRNGYLR